MDSQQKQALDRYLTQSPPEGMTQDEAIELARAHAATSLELREVARDGKWLPPEWVVAAILEAANG